MQQMAAHFCQAPLNDRPTLASVYEHVPLQNLQRHHAEWPTTATAMGHIFVMKAAAMSEQRLCLAAKLPQLIKQQRDKVAKGVPGQKVMECCSKILRVDAGAVLQELKLVIVDSIAALFRVEFESSEYLARSRSLVEQARMLNELANKYGVVVVVANQVSDVFSESGLEALGKGEVISSGRLVKPALGMVWSQSIFQRLVISKKPGARAMMGGEDEETMGSAMESAETVATRELVVNFAPHLPQARCGFKIDGGGVYGLPRA